MKSFFSSMAFLCFQGNRILLRPSLGSFASGHECQACHRSKVSMMSPVRTVASLNCCVTCCAMLQEDVEATRTRSNTPRTESELLEPNNESRIAAAVPCILLSALVNCTLLL